MRLDRPVLQVALDFENLPRALQAAKEAVEGGADWVEAGTPLLKSEGLDAVRALKKAFPGHRIVADMKVMDTGAFEVEIAAKAGADLVTVLGASDDETIADAVRGGEKYGAEVVDRPPQRARPARPRGPVGRARRRRRVLARRDRHADDRSHPVREARRARAGEPDPRRRGGRPELGDDRRRGPSRSADPDRRRGDHEERRHWHGDEADPTGDGDRDGRPDRGIPSATAPTRSAQRSARSPRRT